MIEAHSKTERRDIDMSPTSRVSWSYSMEKKKGRCHFAIICTEYHFRKQAENRQVFQTGRVHLRAYAILFRLDRIVPEYFQQCLH